MSLEFDFALTPHHTPDLEIIGHKWEIIEIQPREVTKLLV
jgi:import inner membrane translocase subunit TIM44